METHSIRQIWSPATKSHALVAAQCFAVVVPVVVDRWLCSLADWASVGMPFVPTVEGLTFGGSDGGEQRVERPRQGIPANGRLHEQLCVAQLAARAAAQEPPHLRSQLDL